LLYFCSGSCGHKKQFLQLVDEIKKNVPDAVVAGTAGRQGKSAKVSHDYIIEQLKVLLVLILCFSIF